MLLIFLLFIAVVLFIFCFVIHIYGICLSFKHSWVTGAASLFVPLFAHIIGGAKLLFNKNLLGDK